jgi:hypothetical protein
MSMKSGRRLAPDVQHVVTPAPIADTWRAVRPVLELLVGDAHPRVQGVYRHPAPGARRVRTAKCVLLVQRQGLRTTCVCWSETVSNVGCLHTCHEPMCDIYYISMTVRW